MYCNVKGCKNNSNGYCENDVFKLHNYELAQLIKKFKLDATGHVTG